MIKKDSSLNSNDQSQVLPSWNDGSARQAIVDFVQRVATPGSKDFVPEFKRIATFDNDGTLWPERPMYVQLSFAIERIKALAPQHPEWESQQPFKAALENDKENLIAAGMKGLIQLVMASHSGMTTSEFEQIVKDWLSAARHPRFNQPYTSCVYQPMLELLDYLRANGFKIWIVSGGGIEFLRTWVEDVYGIPPEQVIGSSINTKFEIRDGTPVLIRLPEVDFIDDNEGKPVSINKFIGHRPIAAFGNSDGDLQMLQWIAAGAGPRLTMLLHHTDAEREWAYDHDVMIGRLVKALDEAKNRGWTVIDMKNDWKRVFAFKE